MKFLFTINFIISLLSNIPFKKSKTSSTFGTYRVEKPHFHDHHDLTVIIVSGKSIIHFWYHEVLLEEGDVVSIPKGVYHWAENIDSKATVVFATFSPPYRGKDKRLAKSIHINQ